MDKSETIGALAAALSKAQGEFEAVPFNATNRFLNNRYADLGAVIQTAKPIIANYGLAVAQLTEDCGDGFIGVTTILMHCSGEWLSARVSLPVGEEKGKSRAQVAGSIVSYLRRYAYASILGLYAEEETDGNTDPHQTVSNRRDHERGNTVAETTKGRPTAEDMREKAKTQQDGTPQQPSDPDAIPDEPGAIVAWFNAQLATLPKYTWSEETIAANAKGLAMRFKNAGITDEQRHAVYKALTGKEHGAKFTPQQIAAMNKLLSSADKLQALARWHTERTSKASRPQLDPAMGG